MRRMSLQRKQTRYSSQPRGYLCGAVLVSSILVLCLAAQHAQARHFTFRQSGQGPDSFFGVALFTPYQGADERYARIVARDGFALGAKWFVLSHWDSPFTWSRIEATLDQQGRPAFSPPDDVATDFMKLCRDRGIRTVVTLAYSNPLYYPDWLYTPDSPEDCQGSQRWCFFVRSLDDPGATDLFVSDDPQIGTVKTKYICAEWLAHYMKYCKTVAEHYGDLVDAWQVWEEENWVPSGSSATDSCICKSEFWRPYPPFASKADWEKMTRLYAEMLFHVAPLLKQLTPNVSVIFGSTCGCDIDYTVAVLREMVSLGATPEFFRDYIDCYGFHGFRSGVWRSPQEQYLGSPEMEVPFPHQFQPGQEGWGSCSMFTHYEGLGPPSKTYLSQIALLRHSISAITGQAPEQVRLFCTEDCGPFHYDWGCREHKRGFIRMAKYLGRSFLTNHFAGVFVAHWQLQEGSAGPHGADYGLINRTHGDSGCRYNADRPYMAPELRRQAFYTFQAIASIYDTGLAYLNPSQLGVLLFDRPPQPGTLPLVYQPRPEPAQLQAADAQIALLLHLPKADPKRTGQVYLASWRMTKFPLDISAVYRPRPGITYVNEDESRNPNTTAVWVSIDLASPELGYQTTTPPEVWELSTLPQGDLQTLEVSCPEKLLKYSIDPSWPTRIIIQDATVSDYVNVIQIAPAEFPTIEAAGTLDSYLEVSENGITGTILLVARPLGWSFVNRIKVFWEEYDLGAELHDDGASPDATARDGIFTGTVTAPGHPPSPPKSLIADGAKHPIILAAGIDRNAIFAQEGGSFSLSAYAVDPDHIGDPAAVKSCEVRVPGTGLVFPMQRSLAGPGTLDAYRWEATIEIGRLDWLEQGLWRITIVAIDDEGLESVPWPYIPTGDGQYIDGLYLNLRLLGKGQVWRRCWPELRVR